MNIQNRLLYTLKNILIITACLCFLGCQSSEDKQLPAKYNPILENPSFIKNLAGFNIMLIAPGSGVDPEKIASLKDIPGLNLQMPEKLVSEAIPYHSDSDEARFLALKSALEDDNPNTLMWAVRGGYGTQRLIEQLQKLPKPKKQKVVIGYSDITALHLFLSQQWGWKTIHGAMLSDLLNEKYDPQNFQKLSEAVELLVESPRSTNSHVHLEINHLMPLNESAKKMSTVQGRLTGGNLTLIQNSIGTIWEIETNDKILFLEDDGEKGYKIDRMLEHLKQDGKLKTARAIIFGDFTGADEYVQFAIQRFADENAIPVFKTDEFGHGIKNYPLIYNSESMIENSKENDDNYNLIMR